MTSPLRFQEKRVIITGGASGIGASCAARFGQEGAHVVVVDVNERLGQRQAADLQHEGIQAQFIQADVGSADGWKHIAAAAPHPDVLVLNAFTIRQAAAHELGLADWQHQLDVNLTQLYLAVHTFVQHLVVAQGNLVAVSSVHSKVGLPGHPAYAASKAGMCGLVRQVAAEYGPRVRANSVVPGPILTQQWAERSEQALEEAARSTALQRMGTAAEVAAVVCFLASDEASYITGASVVVDGGWTIVKDSP